MRVISQLVPKGQPVSTDIEASRQPGRREWEVPAWGHPLALGVYPLFIIRKRRIMPIGTAFCISKLGVSVTSLHNIREAFRSCLSDFSLCRAGETGAHYTFKSKDAGMAVFHHQVLSGRRLSGNILEIESVDGALPSDAAYIMPQFRKGLPYLPLPVSFAVPGIGSRVVCAGFQGLPELDDGFAMDDVQYGGLKLLGAYEHKLHAVEGRVTRIFTKRFTDEFIGGPCFAIDAGVDHGMYGGPVFTENGYVCGLISAATDFFGEPASLISMLHPSLTMKIRFGGQIGSLRINSNRRLEELITEGSVTTDGSENLVKRYADGGGFLPSPDLCGGDSDRIYDDLSCFRKGHDGTENQKGAKG